MPLTTIIAAGVALVFGLSLPVLMWWLLRVAGREEQALEREAARALARVAQSIAKPAARHQRKDRAEARPRAKEAA